LGIRRRVRAVRTGVQREGLPVLQRTVRQVSLLRRAWDYIVIAWLLVLAAVDGF
jgi:hypothetical protein